MVLCFISLFAPLSFADASLTLLHPVPWGETFLQKKLSPKEADRLSRTAACRKAKRAVAPTDKFKEIERNVRLLSCTLLKELGSSKPVGKKVLGPPAQELSKLGELPNQLLPAGAKPEKVTAKFEDEVATLTSDTGDRLTYLTVARADFSGSGTEEWLLVRREDNVTGTFQKCSFFVLGRAPSGGLEVRRYGGFGRCG